MFDTVDTSTKFTWKITEGCDKVSIIKSGNRDNTCTITAKRVDKLSDSIGDVKLKVTKAKIGIITVNVPNGNSTISPSSSPIENFSPYTVCATTISVPSISYRCSITLDPTQSMPEISNGSVSWTHGQFSHFFGQLNPPSSMPTDVDVIVYVVPGIYQPEPEVAAFTSFNLQNNCDGIIVFTGSSLSTRPYVVAHELGHFFMGTGADVSPQEDLVNLMISGGSGDPAPDAGNTTELRYMQWKKINP